MTIRFMLVQNLQKLRFSIRKSWQSSRKFRSLCFCLIAFFIFLIAWLFSLPKDLFKEVPYSTVVQSADSELLGARIASDGQWRFPPVDTVPFKYKTCLIAFEDRYFKYHPGVNPLAVARATVQNIKTGRRISGASTISMQVIRLSRGKERNLWQKVVEALLALRLEWRYSKEEILALYASHAPFGGNVVGLEAASWRYFSSPPGELSWAESALLAVLPNSPSLLHTGRNRELLVQKRNRLLKYLYDEREITCEQYQLAIEEPIPEHPQALPQFAFHQVEHLHKNYPGQRIVSSINYPLQIKLEENINRWNAELSLQGIKDLSAVIIDVESLEILAYVGNANIEKKRYGAMVDIARSPRSTGSVLKPFLYALSLQEGEILPKTLIKDVPLNINGFSPQNFNLNFSGAVPASEALALSLNVPTVFMLRQYGVPKFYDALKRCGMTTLNRPASDYGLSLILGGAEGSLLEITSIYAKMSYWYQFAYANSIFKKSGLEDNWPMKDKCSLWYTFEALKEVNRPDELDLSMVSSLRSVAWKTGTSYGFRDAWAIGVTSKYAVGIWAGNASGEYNPGLIGSKVAGPILFDIYNLLPKDEWFLEPSYKDYIELEVCAQSGHLCGQHCEEKILMKLPPAALHSEPCPYHKQVRISPDGKYRVNQDIESSKLNTFFVLPPSMEWYYRKKHPEYRLLPPFKNIGNEADMHIPMEFIYPESGANIMIPKRLDGTEGKLVLNLAHTNPEKEVYWHLDSSYIGKTKHLHQFAVHPSLGKHNLCVVDSDGNTLFIYFTIVK